MGRSNKPNPNIGGKLGLVAGIVSAVTPVAIEFIDRIPRKDETEPSEELISMPELCSKKFPLKLDEAKELIEGHGLKALPIEVRIRDAHVRYKDCFDLQVVACNKKANSKLKPGEVVIIQYVTREVIDESLRIFEEAERQKAALKQERADRRAEKWEHIKPMLVILPSKQRPALRRSFIETTKRKSLTRRILMSSGKKRSGGGLLLDLILTICTGGLWLIWILIRYLRNNS